MFYDNFLNLCNQKGISPSAAAVEMGFQKSVVTRWKKSIPTEANRRKIAEYFGISVDELMGTKKAPIPGLTAKDERDIAKKLQETLDDLENGADGLMFDGEPLDDETRELLRDSLQNQLQMTKLLAKKKFTPKKYRQ